MKKSKDRVIVNEIGMLDDYQLTQLDKDPGWEQFDVVKIKGCSNDKVVVSKSKDRAITEYGVCSVVMLPLHINSEGMKEFYKKNPNLRK